MANRTKVKEQPTEQTATGQQPSQAEEKKPTRQRIIFVGEGEPKINVRIGMLRLELPGADEQRTGFETEHARLILTNLRGYKKDLSKAKKPTPTPAS